jgi:hypothetical protein
MGRGEPGQAAYRRARAVAPPGAESEERLRHNPARRGYAKASRPRHSPGVMNNTEREYADMLDIRRAAGEITAYWFERLTLKLAADSRYTPDFLVLLSCGALEIHEVKGSFIRDDAAAKLKIAADVFPYRFILAQRLSKKQGGGWKIEPVPSDTWGTTWP